MIVIDFHWVLPLLAVGARLDPATIELVARRGVRAVVDMRDEEADDEALLARHGLELLHLPTPDTLPSPLAMLEQGTAWVEQRLAQARPVLIHCQHGIGRSALLGLCVLVRTGLSPLEALQAVKKARPAISPSPKQLEQYRAWVSQVRRPDGSSWPVPTLAELGTIAYSHLRQIVTGEG